MTKKMILLSLCTSISLFAQGDIDTLKTQLSQQQAITQALQKRLDLLETTQTKKAGSPNTSASFSQKAYLPDIALILNMSTIGRNVKNSDYESYAIPGFIASGDAELPFNKARGFNFNYAEVAMSSTVDPYFDAFAIFHLHPDQLEIEEAFIRARALPLGLRIKAGKFRSAFGRLNEMHQHSWHFDSQAIIYKALLGPDCISDAGVQLQWVAPTDSYMMLGGEAFQGGNDRSFGDVEKNNLYVGYLKSSIDIGDDLSVLGGVSLAHGKHEGHSSDIYGVDLTLRQELGGYSALTWQSEFLQRDMDVNSKQAGLYSELIYKYDNHYSTGIRYDAITKNDTDLSKYPNIDTKNLDRYTAMVEYHPFPMSRLRLSYAHDRTKVIAGERKDNDQITLSINIATGAHGAHNY